MPKVIFRKNELNATVDFLVEFLVGAKEADFWAKTIYSYYPVLKEKINSNMSKDEVSNILTNFLSYHHDQIDDKVIAKFKNAWDEINDDFFSAMEEIFEMDLPDNLNEIYVNVNTNVMCPRDLSIPSFDLFYLFDVNAVIEIFMHEIVHLVYFEKWKQIFPNYDRESFEAPHIIWRLSEMMIDPIFGDDLLIPFFKVNSMSYEEFYNIWINGQNLMAILCKMYYEKESIEDFMKSAYDFVLKYQGQIED